MKIHDIRRFTLFVASGLMGFVAAASVSAQTTPRPVVSLDKVHQNEAAIAALPPQYRQSPKLVVVFDPVIPPMSYKGEDGQPAGAEPTIVLAVGKALGLAVEFLPGGTDAAVAGLQSRRYDMAIGSYISNKQRLQYADIISYLKYGQGIATTPANRNITFDTLCGRSVAVAKGNVQQTVMVPEFNKKCQSEGKPVLDEKVFPEESAIFLAVLSGRVDAALLNEVTIRYHADRADGRMVLAQGGYSTAPRGVLVQKNGLANAVFRAISDLAKDGTLIKILESSGLGAVAIDTPQLNVSN